MPLAAPPSPPRPQTGEGQATGSRQRFAAVFASNLSAFLAIGAVLPVLPRYTSGPLGGGPVAVGVVIGAFAFSAVVSRPLAGRLADGRGRRTIVIWGTLLMAAAGALYFIPAGVGGLVVARLVLGVGEGFAFTAGATWAVDLAPLERRGQAIGVYGLSIWGGLALGPPIGEALFALGSYELVWAFAILGPLAGAALAARVPDLHRPAVASGPRPLLPAVAVRPGIALALANVGYAALAGFIILHLENEGSGSGAAVFAAFAAAVVTTRLLGSSLPDRIGARGCAMAAGGAEAAGLALIALATDWPVAVAGALVMGGGFSLLFPALALMVVNEADEDQRGAALGTFTAFFDVGVGLGAPLVGAAAALGGYPAGYWLAAACAAATAAIAYSLRVAPPAAARAARAI